MGGLEQYYQSFCDMARSPLLLNLSALEGLISFAITASSMALFFITLNSVPYV